LESDSRAEDLLDAIHFTRATMDFVRGTKVDRSRRFARPAHLAGQVNRLLVRCYLKQLLEDGFFMRIRTRATCWCWIADTRFL